MSRMCVARSAIGRFIFVTFLTIAFFSVFQAPVHASQLSLSTLTVVGVIEPSRTVVVNNAGNIEKIVSNSPEYVEPHARLNSLDGKEVPYSQAMSTQYTSIMRAYKPLHAYGVLYDAAISQPIAKAVASLNCRVQCLSSLLRSSRLSYKSLYISSADQSRVSVL